MSHGRKLSIGEAKSVAAEIVDAVADMPPQARLVGYRLALLVIKVQRSRIDDTNGQLLAKAGLSSDGHPRHSLARVFDRLTELGMVRRVRRPNGEKERGTVYFTDFVPKAARSGGRNGEGDSRLMNGQLSVVGKPPGCMPESSPVVPPKGASSPGNALRYFVGATKHEPVPNYPAPRTPAGSSRDTRTKARSNRPRAQGSTSRQPAPRRRGPDPSGDRIVTAERISHEELLGHRGAVHGVGGIQSRGDTVPAKTRRPADLHIAPEVSGRVDRCTVAPSDDRARCRPCASAQT